MPEDILGHLFVLFTYSNDSYRDVTGVCFDVAFSALCGAGNLNVARVALIEEYL